MTAPLWAIVLLLVVIGLLLAHLVDVVADIRDELRSARDRH